jgi:hypothetical protein
VSREEKLEELARLTRMMREAQRTYFTRRDRDSLLAAKEAERMVDEALAWLDHR